MERNGAVEISPAQWRAYNAGLGNINGGDTEVLEDLGIPVTMETLHHHVACGAEVAELLREPDPYEGLSGKELFRAVRLALAERVAS